MPAIRCNDVVSPACRWPPVSGVRWSRPGRDRTPDLPNPRPAGVAAIPLCAIAMNPETAGRSPPPLDFARGGELVEPRRAPPRLLRSARRQNQSSASFKSYLMPHRAASGTISEKSAMVENSRSNSLSKVRRLRRTFSSSHITNTSSKNRSTAGRSPAITWSASR